MKKLALNCSAETQNRNWMKDLGTDEITTTDFSKRCKRRPFDSLPISTEYGIIQLGKSVNVSLSPRAHQVGHAADAQTVSARR
jgi:hypothetical protein